MAPAHTAGRAAGPRVCRTPTPTHPRPSPTPNPNQVVQAVLEYAGPETLPLMADIAHELLGLLDDAADARGARPGGGRGRGDSHRTIHGDRGDNQRAGQHAPPALLPCLRATHALVGDVGRLGRYQEVREIREMSGG